MTRINADVSKTASHTSTSYHQITNQSLPPDATDYVYNDIAELNKHTYYTLFNNLKKVPTWTQANTAKVILVARRCPRPCGVASRMEWTLRADLLILQSSHASATELDSSLPDFSEVDNSGGLTGSTAQSESVQRSKNPPEFAQRAFSDSSMHGTRQSLFPPGRWVHPSNSHHLYPGTGAPSWTVLADRPFDTTTCTALRLDFLHYSR